MTRPSYQLTDHPVTSLREIWALTWPLMLSLMSGSIMMFVDRLYLAHYSVEAMNAVAIAGITGFLLLIVPMSICEMTEVFVGRLHGENSLEKLGKPVWQMLWFCLFCFPVLAIISQIAAPLVFGQDSFEAIYSATFLSFAGPCFLASVTLMGFFIAIGKPKVITISTILANCMNTILAPICIFGMFGIPSLGIKGAAISTGFSLGFQALLLAFLFLRKMYRSKYGTNALSFDKTLFFEMVKVGFPSGLSRATEILAHCAFFQIMKLAGKEALTCVTTVQSFYLLTGFCIESVSKSVTAIISNLIGGNATALIRKAIGSAFKLHLLICSIVATLFYFSINFGLKFLLAAEDQGLLYNESFMTSLKVATLWMCIFFFFDGLCWVLMGYLTALRDTKFIFFVNLVSNWTFYVVPLYLLVTYSHLTGAGGWTVIAINSMILFSIFLWRTRNQLLAARSALPEKI